MNTSSAPNKRSGTTVFDAGAGWGPWAPVMRRLSQGPRKPKSAVRGNFLRAFPRSSWIYAAVVLVLLTCVAVVFTVRGLGTVEEQLVAVAPLLWMMGVAALAAALWTALSVLVPKIQWLRAMMLGAAVFAVVTLVLMWPLAPKYWSPIDIALLVGQLLALWAALGAFAQAVGAFFSGAILVPLLWTLGVRPRAASAPLPPAARPEPGQPLAAPGSPGEQAPR